MSSVGDVASTVLPMSSPISWTSTTKPPLDYTHSNELHPLRASKSGVTGPRTMDLGHNTGPHIGAYSTPALEQAFEYADERGDLIPHKPCLSIDQVLSPGLNGPTLRRQSTRQLIHRFESMTGATEMVQVARPSGSTRTSSGSDSRDMHRHFLTVAPHKSKRRSLSNSLRNFMSVFKKKKDKESDDDDHVPPCHVPELNPEVPMPLPKSQMVSRPSGKEIALSPNRAGGSMVSGSLLYLSRPPSHPPVWMSCKVTLYNSRLLITWYTMHDTPSSHIIQLDGFMDVRSLNERVSRPENEDDLRSFELSFEGRPRETFAATSSQDRARWIGAIW